MTDVSNGNQYACKIIPKNRMQRIHMQKVRAFSRENARVFILVSANNARLRRSQIAREIMIHKELNHVNVVQMHHYFEDNLNVYMLLEACPRKVSRVSYLPYQFIVPLPGAFCALREKNFATLPFHVLRPAPMKT